MFFCELNSLYTHLTNKVNFGDGVYLLVKVWGNDETWIRKGFQFHWGNMRLAAI